MKRRNKEEKIEEARALLWEVKLEEQKERQKETDKINQHFCLCGHVRGNHGKSLSINFTDGMCIECKCRGFQYSISKNEPPQSFTG